MKPKVQISEHSLDNKAPNVDDVLDGALQHVHGDGSYFFLDCGFQFFCGLRFGFKIFGFHMTPPEIFRGFKIRRVDRPRLSDFHEINYD